MDLYFSQSLSLRTLGKILVLAEHYPAEVQNQIKSRCLSMFAQKFTSSFSHASKSKLIMSALAQIRIPYVDPEAIAIPTSRAKLI